jgi:hypothetical protein
MSDASSPTGSEKSIEELKKELDEVADEIEVARHEADAEHSKKPHFIDGAVGEDD